MRYSSFFASLGFAFLYIPIGLLILYSFNESQIVTVWSRFSFKWYQVIWRDKEFIDALLTSLKISSLSASFAVIIGSFMGITLNRSKFFSKNFYAFLTPAPLIIPEIILGFSFLILFGLLSKITGWPSKMGQTTIIISHITLCMSYVSVIVHMRLAELDMSIIEAAMDLGATPSKVFFFITCPMIAPTLITGWLLSFTLSFDDLIISSFTTGPGTTTLPMLIYSRMKLGVNPEINVLGSILIFLVIIFAIIIYYFKKEKKIYHNSKSLLEKK